MRRTALNCPSLQIKYASNATDCVCASCWISYLLPHMLVFSLCALIRQSSSDSGAGPTNVIWKLRNREEATERNLFTFSADSKVAPQKNGKNFVFLQYLPGVCLWGRFFFIFKKCCRTLLVTQLGPFMLWFLFISLCSDAHSLSMCKVSRFASADWHKPITTTI